jgi:MFS family permease
MHAAGLFPCITVYVMMTYRREETGRRMSYIFMCAALAGAVGGLISGGLVTIETGSIVGWQYLYIVGNHSSRLVPMLTYRSRALYP